ncbi:MAG: ArnT family glycosyltransferase [Caulobacteraceae bacterium]
MTDLFNQLRTALTTKRGMALALLALTLMMYLSGQASIPPIDRDEARFAQASRQMLDSGDFVDVRFMDQARNLQPAGIYWLQTASVTLFGNAETRTIWPHRVPSWLSAIGVAFLTWWVGALLFGAPVGRYAAVLMASCFLLSVEAHIAKIDATLCFAVLLAQAALAKIHTLRHTETPVGWYAAVFWAALGFGILLKGPIILMITGGAILALGLLERRARWLGKLQPLWGVPLMLAIAAPWYVAIGISTNGEFFRTALGYSLVGKLTQAHQSHGGIFGYHALLSPLLFWPGSLFAILAMPFAWAQRKSDAVRFCLAWIVPAWLVFELSGTKLPHYTLPLLPAVAILAAAGLVHAEQRRFYGRPWLFAIAALIWLVMGLIVTTGFVAIQDRLQGGAQLVSVALAALAVACMLAVLWFIAKGRLRTALVAAAASAAIASFNNYQLVVPSLNNLFMSPRVIAAVDTVRPCDETQLVSYSYREPSLVFLYPGGRVFYPGTLEQAAEDVSRDPACSLILTDANDQAFIDAVTESVGEMEVAARVGRGFNHNSGDEVDLTIYRLRQPSSR